ncbi:hypothetical protein LPJ60_006571, partial [Coemansia sp. RSA 2675]
SSSTSTTSSYRSAVSNPSATGKTRLLATIRLCRSRATRHSLPSKRRACTSTPWLAQSTTRHPASTSS